MAASFMQFNVGELQMGQIVEQYERDGYCIADEQIAPERCVGKGIAGDGGRARWEV